MPERDFLVPINMNQLEIYQPVVHLLASDPGSPVNGQIWVNTTSWEMKIRLNGATHTIARLAHTLNQFAAPTASLNLNSQKITSLADGTAAGDAVNKGQLDAASAGLDPKASVRAATTGNITNLAGGAPNTLDGVSLAANDRILVKDQSTGSQNGIYIVQTLGTGSNGTWVRAADADTSAEVTTGMFTFVEEGTLAGDTGWVLTTNNPITLGTTALAFSKFTAAATGVQKFSTSTHASATSFAVNHGLNSTAVHVQVFDNSTGIQEECEVTITDANNVTLAFAVAPSANSKRIVVIG